ncbi:hypothetical protein O181_101759 [Austropuccinia psidii MF-1]|uniref:CCHC-type domain-containing protein n=1 Tax=Austropuccinia psidii MF-1 TaxID=1389203 RepID=A0A9Q3JHU3_9BASI|nr:hypothetical protein [Austropuccinia psidii MF-1]
MEKIIKNIQEGHAQLRKASEETNKRLNLVFEEKHHSKRDRDHLDQDINKLFNVYHSMKLKPQGHVMDNLYHQDEIKPDAMLINKAISPSQYQDGDNMSYSEKKALKLLPEASSWPKFCGTGEYDHMELINFIDRLFIDVPRIPDYWITARFNTAFKGHSSIWYTEMKEIHYRRNWKWWNSQIIQNYSNGTWIWQNTISFENDKYSVEKDPYEWCLRQSKRLKAIDSQMNIQMRNHKLLTQILGELGHVLRCRCNHNCTLYDIANTIQDVRKRTNIGKYIPYNSSGFKEKQPFRVEFKDKPRERVAEVAKKKNSCHNCCFTDHYAKNCPKAKKKVSAIEKVPEEESPAEGSDSYSMGDAIREQSEDDQSPREEFLVEYQEENPLEIHDIQLEAGMPQNTANKNFGAHCSIVARNDLENHFQNWAKQLFPTKAKSFKSASGKLTSIRTIIKEIVKPHRKGNIRLNPEFIVLDDANIQGFLLGTDYQRMYGIDIYNSKNRQITIGTNKEKKFSLDRYKIFSQDPLEELLNEFREGRFSTTLTSKQKLSFLNMLRKNRPLLSIGEEPLGKIRGHDIELYLDVERPYPPILRRPPYPEGLETRKEIEKYINDLLDMDVIRKI